MSAKDVFNQTQFGRQCYHVLLHQYKMGKRESRSETKQKRGGQHANYDRISSAESLREYLNGAAQFVKFIDEEFGLRALRQVEFCHVESFVAFKAEIGGRDGLGTRKKTISSYLTAINHLLIGTQLLKQKKAYTIKVFEDIDMKQDPVYKELTSEEFEQRYPELMVKYDTSITISRAFGLRRQGLFGNGTAAKQGFTSRSVYRSESGNLYCITVEKNGLLRTARCLPELKNRVIEIVHRFDVENGLEPGSSIRELPSEEIITKRWFISQLKRYKWKLSGVANKMSYHIHRAWYAQHMALYLMRDNQHYLTKENEVGYSRVFMKNGHLYRRVDGKSPVRIDDLSWGKINTISGLYIEFLKLSKYLGHNRIDVLERYL